MSGFNRTVGSNPTLSARKRCLLTIHVVSLILVGVACFSRPANAEVCQRTYRVHLGDSWWSIAKSESVGLGPLLEANNASKTTQIRPKDVVCIPTNNVIKKTYTSREIVQMIREVWPDDLEEQAISIATRESRLQPATVGTPNKCCYGLFQIYFRWHKNWLSDLGIVRANQLLDPKVNSLAAYELYKRNNGWGPWRP
ncbi:MAG: LysM peptidoglycan-binding domain-containing protein [Actinobacteria bacterium]|nr:LysM peptidoglycan-binding domain-containing protein [Actinomycetota bacterium]